MASEIQCPVDNISVNESKVRMVAFLVILCMLLYLATAYWPVIAFLIADFFLRAFNLGKYSLLGIVAGFLVKQLKLKSKPVDQAPKRFAAGVGFVFCTLILLSIYMAWGTAVLALCMVLLIFAFLESVLGFCAGCYVYSLLKTFSK